MTEAMEDDSGTAAAIAFIRGDHPPIRVVSALAEELAEHERVLAEIDKESKGKTLWRQLAPQSA